ncbi:MAG: hypothetical protein ACQESU_07575 [Halobacteriota archaeon]
MATSSNSDPLLCIITYIELDTYSEETLNAQTVIVFSSSVINNETVELLMPTFKTEENKQAAMSLIYFKESYSLFLNE